LQFNNFVGKYPPSTQAQLEIYRRIDKIILQNINWIIANQDALSQWLTDNLPTASAATLMNDPLPVSPLEFWNSLPAGLEDKE
jgi:hypothetical protein